ncbi:hypothetical protein QTP70_023064 [Hemibagrus guttatus]|uniref:Peroxiredoxin-like 2A n=1 Tax=Hemibagrus guttatus TaxID=175788 RepID=A0AAE0VDF0_9TELE|nr:hypothetical protein QTP70_023064 [Hemibagrus guttatus]
MLPMTFTQVQPVRLVRFLRRNRANNVVKDQVFDHTSSALQCYSRLSSTSEKKLQILVNKIHPEYESLKFVGCQSSFKSLASVNPYTICMFSTNRQLSVKDQSSQSTICKPKEPLSTVEANTAIVDMWSVTLGAVGAAIAGIILANTDFFLTKPEFATLQYLENADLRTTEGNEKVFKARTLWETSGAVIMAEATELSSLKPQLDKLGVPLYAVVKENIGTEVQDFKPHFAGDVFLDEKQVFYGPMVRKMGGLGFIRLGVWHNFIRAWRSGYQGNMNGEGFILGGVYVIGSGKQGVLLEHREKEFGDKVDYETVLEAAKKIVQK